MIVSNKISEIMLIDDDVPTNYLSNLIIEDKNCCETVSTFNMATEAINALKENQSNNQKLPDIILLDLNMPRMNGWEFMEAFNQFSFEKQMPKVYILTTSMNPDDKTKALKTSSVAGFRKKPLDEDMLDEIIAEFEGE